MGSDINAQIETNRNTALTLACFQGRHEVVSLLLDRKANVEHRAKVTLLEIFIFIHFGSLCTKLTIFFNLDWLNSSHGSGFWRLR